MNNFENKEFCKKCGGYCCIKSGCDYWVDDFDDKSYNGLLEVLATGDISVIALLNFKKIKNDKIIVVPFLGLRARNVDRDVIDLLSIKNTCSMLTEEGCTYNIENRPSGGVNLIPGKNRYQCRPLKNPLEEMQKWESYQKQLRKIVKKYTGKSVEEKLKEDVENLFIAVFNGGLEKAAVEEQQDINNLLSILKRVYPSEYKKAVMSCFEDKKVMIKTKQSL